MSAEGSDEVVTYFAEEIYEGDHIHPSRERVDVCLASDYIALNAEHSAVLEANKLLVQRDAALSAERDAACAERDELQAISNVRLRQWSEAQNSLDQYCAEIIHLRRQGAQAAALAARVERLEGALRAWDYWYSCEASLSARDEAVELMRAALSPQAEKLEKEGE